MHGIIGQLAADPARLAIALAAAVAVIVIVRRLSDLALEGRQASTKARHPGNTTQETEQ